MRLPPSFAALAICALAGATPVSGQQFDCGEWRPSSLQLSGEGRLTLEPDRLVWTNGRRTLTAALAEAVRTRHTYLDDASIIVVYGMPANDSATGTGLSGPLRILRFFYNQAAIQIAEMTCDDAS